MSEWVSVLAVFWILWALDGVRLGKRRMATFVGGSGRRTRGVPAGVAARGVFSRLSLPGVSPGSWRLVAETVPLSLSPVGISNRPIAAAGRPVEPPDQRRVWRWEEVREVGLADGWIYVNGARFCPDTGHVTARELLALARLSSVDRADRLRRLVGRWFRPAHLQRRARVLVGRTRVAARLNAATLAGFLIVTVYFAGDVASRIPTGWSERIAAAAPWVVLGLLALHFTAVGVAWRGLRRLRSVRPEKRVANLFSALLLPPQALRLRALASEGFFPAVHPLAAQAAFGSAAARRAWGFDVVADGRWPVGAAEDSALEREVTAWFGGEVGARVTALLRATGIDPEALLAPPPPDGTGSCQYCPRCRDQFGAGPTVCPHGIPLQPLTPPGQ